MSDNELIKAPLDKYTKIFIKIRDKRAQLKKTFDEEDLKLQDAQNKIKRALLDYCKENNCDSYRSSEGTFTRSVKTKYWTSDWHSMGKFVVENNVPELFAKSLNQGNVKEFLENNPDISPPGLNVSSEYVITIKKPTVKRSKADG